MSALFVDLDGTLIDYDRAVRSAVAAFAGDHPAWRHLDAPQVADAWFATRRDHVLDGAVPLARQRARRMFELAALMDVPCDEATAAAWAATITADAVERCRAFPDVASFLDSAGEVGIVTNGDPAVQKAKLVAAGLEPLRFHPLVTSFEEGRAKPSPELYRFAAQRARQPPAACSMIGDSQAADVQAALAAGFRAAVLIDRSDKPRAPSVPTLGDALQHLRSHGLNRAGGR